VAFKQAAEMPIWRSCATWSCISAMSGEITTRCEHRARGKLVAERFATAVGMMTQRRAPQRAADDGFLARTEVS